MLGHLASAAVLVVVVSVASCTPDTGTDEPGETLAADTGRGAAATCQASGANTTFTKVRRSRVATAAEVLVVDKAGNRHVTSAPRMRGPVVPAAVGSVGVTPTTPSLLHTLRARVLVSLNPGPPTQGATTWSRERLAPGRYIVFTGAEVLGARYSTVCSSGVSTGTVTSWTTPTAGILDCQAPAPDDSLAKIVEHLCLGALPGKRT